MEFDEDGKQKLPSFLQMAKNFSKELAVYIAEGQPNVSQEDYEERLATCDICPHLIKEKRRCGKCGCYLEHKAKWRTGICPDEPSRWKWQDPEPQNEAERKAKEEAIAMEKTAKEERDLYTKEKKKHDIEKRKNGKKEM